MTGRAQESLRQEPAADGELTDEQLEQVAGGSGYLKLGDLKGESTDRRHRDW